MKQYLMCDWTQQYESYSCCDIDDKCCNSCLDDEYDGYERSDHYYKHPIDGKIIQIFQCCQHSLKDMPEQEFINLIERLRNKK